MSSKLIHNSSICSQPKEALFLFNNQHRELFITTFLTFGNQKETDCIYKNSTSGFGLVNNIYFCFMQLELVGVVGGLSAEKIGVRKSRIEKNRGQKKDYDQKKKKRRGMARKELSWKKKEYVWKEGGRGGI